MVTELDNVLPWWSSIHNYSYISTSIVHCLYVINQDTNVRKSDNDWQAYTTLYLLRQTSHSVQRTETKNVLLKACLLMACVHLLLHTKTWHFCQYILEFISWFSSMSPDILHSSKSWTWDREVTKLNTLSAIIPYPIFLFRRILTTSILYE